MVQTTGKTRFGDGVRAANTRLAILSTTNEPLLKMVSAAGSIGGAMASRLVSLEVTGTFGAFDRLPRGQLTSDEAARQIRRAINENYGVAGSQLIDVLVRQTARDEKAIRLFVEQRMDRFERQLARFPETSARIRKAFALVAVAGDLAIRAKVIPKDWGARGQLRGQIDSGSALSFAVPTC